MSFFDRDLHKEQLLSHYLDGIYSELQIKFIRNQNIDLQYKGVDLIFDNNGEKLFIDEKAQLDYINNDLPTFTFELSYLKDGSNKLGWFLDEKKITSHYFLITGIYANDINDLSKGFKSCKITSVERKKLIGYLDSKGLTKEKLDSYQNDMRIMVGGTKKTTIPELNSRTQGCLFYSDHLSEKPINLQLKLNYLLEEKATKRIYPLQNKRIESNLGKG